VPRARAASVTTRHGQLGETRRCRVKPHSSCAASGRGDITTPRTRRACGRRRPTATACRATRICPSRSPTGPADRRAGLAHLFRVTAPDDLTGRALVRRGLALEWSTLGWNVAGIVVLAFAAITARSVALAGFGLDSLVEIGASTVVIWELSGTGAERQRRGLRLIGYAFAALAAYLLVQSTAVLATGYHPRHSTLGIIWTAATAGSSPWPRAASHLRPVRRHRR